MRMFERITARLDEAAPTDPRTVAKHVDVNPATGLPTIGGAGTPDVAVNPYGSAWSNDSEYDWQRHERWDSGVYDPSHDDNWSVSSHDPWRD
ncbi:hypothetical protein HRV97_16100 [Sphingomonas sp. HHU CXW]|uniref:Uncharacterized protein n=1 Tax=Sphingomonas hominis TaxID=2741495 RepID=A0ABX2JUH1_9SPHN|nr:hypothetical protein [Sphingomonas hominis]NTS66672.1 hypothetical protein [Sphingomonas hominis]